MSPGVKTRDERADPSGGAGASADGEASRPEINSETEPERGSPSDDEIFEVLSNRRRRQVIQYLREHDGRASVSDLAEYIAIDENDTTRQQLSSDERKRVYVSLYQNHLPVMDDADVVDYAENRKTVQLLEAASELEPYIENDADRIDTRNLTAVTLVIAGSVLLGSFQVGPFALVPRAGWTLLGIVGLVAVTCYEAWNASTDLRDRLSILSV